MTIHSPIYYLPPVSWFINAIQSDEVQLCTGIEYRKNLKLNRCRVAGANGIILLSVPLEQGRQQHGLVKEIKISSAHSWQKIHLNSIFSAYGKAPFFIYYADGLKRLFSEEKLLLTDWNYVLLQYCFQCLKLSIPLVLNEETSVGELTTVQNSTSSILPRYPQVFEDRHGFISDLSIIDLIFNLGPDARNYLRKLTVK